MDNFSKDDNNIKLDVTSKYGGVIDTDIRFFTSDRGTAVLNFMVTKNNFPLSISENHAKSSIVLKTSNYDVDNGAYVSDDLEVVDAINGKLQYTLPIQFLKYNGKVEAQVYFTQNGNGNVIVERSFTFKIDNDLISDFDGKTKLTYIKSMQDLVENVADEVKNVKASLSNATSLVSSIKSEVSKGIQQLEIKQNDVVQMITQTQNTSMTALDNKVKEVESKTKVITDKINEYETRLTDQDVLKKADTSNWQKYKLTNDDGTIYDIPDANIADVLQSSKTSRVVHLSYAKDAPSLINIKDDKMLAEIPIEDGVPDDEENDNQEPEVNIQTTNIVASGLLIICITNESIGRAEWRPDSTNEVFTTYKTNGTWLPFEKFNSQDVTRESIEIENNNILNQSKNYTDSKFNDITWQKFKLTDDNGFTKNIDIAGSKDRLLALSTGNYYVINPPDTPDDITIKEGYLNVTSKDEINKLFEFTPINTNKVIKRRTINGSLENGWFTTNEYKKTLLFSGAANGVGTELALTDDFNNYSLLVISGDYPGGNFNETSLVGMTGSIVINKTNLLDTDGNGGAIYELILQKTSNKTLRIINDVKFDLSTLKGTGANANKITINRIEGWK